MAERTNEAWVADLRGPGREQTLADLRNFLVRGLGYAMADRPSVTEADVEDFAQEALMKIVDNLDSFRGESRFTTWAQKIAVRVAFTELRRKRWKDVSLQDLITRYDGVDFTPVVLTDPDASPEQRAGQQAMMDIVQRLITEELTDRQRQALTAVMIGGMSTEEVARRMGTNRNALYKLLHDARQKLKQQMTAEGLSIQDVLSAFA